MKKPSTDASHIEQALAALLRRIEAGEEFPDAVWAVTRSCCVDHQALVDAYDAHEATR